MMAITYRKLTEDDELDLNLPNEPIDIIGQLNVNRSDNRWTYTREYFTDKTEMTFPDENYDIKEVLEGGVAFGAYDHDKCIGLAIMQDDWTKFMYLVDLKVNRNYRKQGIARELINECRREAVERKYKGIYTVAQDNNLIACRFYLKDGFEIGGLNTHGYRYTTQEHKSDIYFYSNNKNQ
ncbi:MAG: GNAT family N-acetyltransferase [Alkalibacterium sp.]